MVATMIAGQNMASLALTTANTAGSEPSGTRVAETKAMRKTDVSPTVGAARTLSSQRTAVSIIESCSVRWEASIIMRKTHRPDTIR